MPEGPHDPKSMFGDSLPSGPPPVNPIPSGPPPVVWEEGGPPPLVSEEDSPDDSFDWRDSSWGLGDVLLGFPVIAASSLLGAVLGAILGWVLVSDTLGLGLGGIEPARGFDAVVEHSAFLAATTILTMLGFQLATFSWPILVARWKGKGVGPEFGFRFRWIDLVIGPVAALTMMMAAGLVNTVVAKLVGLGDATQANNTDFLADSGDGPLKYFLILFVVIGAPLSEEMFFRGLTLRALQKRWGKPAALIGSTLLFSSLHFGGGGWRAVTVVLVTITSIGGILGLLALVTGRLGPCVVAHGCFNGFVTLVLFNADRLENFTGAIGKAGALLLQTPLYGNGASTFWP